LAKKKKKYIPPPKDDAELQEMREHWKVINEKTKEIVERYRKWWDKDKRKWKEGYKQNE